MRRKLVHLKPIVLFLTRGDRAGQNRYSPRIADTGPGEREQAPGIFLSRARQNPSSMSWGFALKKTLAMTYSRMRMHTTIGAAAFHFRVRDGIGWYHSAVITRERVEGRRPYAR